MSVLGSLMEKLQHAGSSTCLLHTVEQGGGVSDTAELRDGVSQAGGTSSLCWGAFSVGGAVSFGVHSLLERYFSLQAEISGRQSLGHFLYTLSISALGPKGETLPFPRADLKEVLPFLMGLRHWGPRHGGAHDSSTHSLRISLLRASSTPHIRSPHVLAFSSLGHHDIPACESSATSGEAAQLSAGPVTVIWLSLTPVIQPCS